MHVLGQYKERICFICREFDRFLTLKSSEVDMLALPHKSFYSHTAAIHTCFQSLKGKSCYQTLAFTRTYITKRTRRFPLVHVSECAHILYLLQQNFWWISFSAFLFLVHFSFGLTFWYYKGSIELLVLTHNILKKTFESSERKKFPLGSRLFLQYGAHGRCNNSPVSDICTRARGSSQS